MKYDSDGLPTWGNQTVAGHVTLPEKHVLAHEHIGDAANAVVVAGKERKQPRWAADEHSLRLGGIDQGGAIEACTHPIEGRPHRVGNGCRGVDGDTGVSQLICKERPRIRQQHEIRRGDKTEREEAAVQDCPHGERIYHAAVFDREAW